MTARPENTGLAGRAYEARKSRPVNARAVARADTGGGADGQVLDVLDEAGNLLASAPASQIKVETQLGRAPRRLVFPGGLLCETRDSRGVDRLTGRTPGGRLQRWEAYHPRLAAVVLATLASVWLVYRYGLDLLVSVAIAMTPPALLPQMDRGILQTIDLTLAWPSGLSEGAMEYDREIFDSLLAHLAAPDRDGSQFQLVFRDMPDVGPNAFALPGGTVVMTDDFARMFGDPDQVAGVLAHEIGHVVEKHGLRQIYRSVGGFALIAFLAGDTGPVLEDMLLEGSVVFALAYSRRSELSADQFGLRLADQAGYDPLGLKQFLQAAGGADGGEAGWLSTHPGSAERNAAIDAWIAERR
jgi:Zn-dependent protease with chaperone function